MDDHSQSVSKELQVRTGGSLFPSSVITRKDLVGLVHTFHLPMGHRVLIPRASDSPTHPPLGYVAISSHHLLAGLRFPLPRFLIKVLNLLQLTPIQLTPNVYTWLLSFYLIFRRKRIGSPTDNIIRHYFHMKKCPLNKKLPGKTRHDKIYYLPVRSSDYRALLQSDIKSNVGDYKASYFYITGLEIESVEHKRLVLSPCKFLVF
ncbi:hypothetical protein ACOSP7_014235 [Xanthoceras sorbifolium]